MGRTAIGVDIGGTRLRVAHIAADGAILSLAKADSSSDPEIVLSRIEALIEGLGATTASAIGIGAPGRVDGRKVLSGGFVDLSRIPVADRIENRFGLPVAVDNDCTMAMIGETAFGAAKGFETVVMLTIGTGIGGAVLEGGKVLRGKGTAGQLGHIAVDPNGLVCVCGKRGCVETVSSGTALGRHIAEAGLPRGTTMAELLELGNNGELTAASILHAWAAPLRVAIDSLVTTLDPQIVVLGGGLGKAAVGVLSKMPAPQSWFACDVVHARLGDDAGVIGAGVSALASSAPGSKRLVLVNGVPASGKSTVAKSLARESGWPILSLDTIKNPFLEEIEDVDRPFNRKLGLASLKAMFSIVTDAPAGSTFILDAWFGFQPREFVMDLLAQAGVTKVAEIWCSAPPELTGARYGARIADRPPGHPGAEYVQELVLLAARAEPVRIGPLLAVDTTQAIDPAAMRRWMDGALG